MLRLSDLLRISLRQVSRQRIRYLGVVLTVTLGTAGFIAVNTVGRDVKRNLNRDLETLGGVTLLKVYYDDPYWFQQPSRFQPETLRAIREISGVQGVSRLTMKMTAARSTRRGEGFNFPLAGVDEQFWAVNSFSAVAGRLFSAEEVAGRKPVCVLGAQLARNLLGEEDPVGRMIPIDRDLYRITGVLDGPGVGDRDQWAFVPLTTATDRIYPLAPPNRLYVRCRSLDAVPRVSRLLPAAVAVHQPADHLKVEVGWQRLRRVKKIVWWVETFILVAVGVTLGLGGLGIWTIMMSAVRARTREIGLKKAMGAGDADILRQFLAEALLLSLGAGLLGLVLGNLAVRLVSRVLGTPPPMDLLWSYTGVGLVLSLAVGISAGFYPAYRASRMEVVSAIRYE